MNHRAPSPTTVNENWTTDAAITEIGRLGNSIYERMSAGEKFIAIAGTLAAAGLTLGQYQKIHQVLIGLPVVLIYVFIYTVQIYTDAALMAGNRAALELYLSKKEPRQPLIGQSVLAANHIRRASVWMTLLLAAALLGAAIWSGAAEAAATWHLGFGPRALSVGAAIGVVWGLATLLVAAREMLVTEDQTRELAIRQLNI